MVELDLNQDELLSTFIAESAEQIAALEAGLLSLERDPSDTEVQRELLRYAHTLKGNASCVGMHEITSFAHAYEEMLEQIGAEGISPALTTLMLSGIDNFRRLLAGPQSAQSVQSSSASRSLRISCDRLDRMLDLSGEISIAHGRVREMLGGGAAASDLIETEREIGFLHGELQDLIMRARMVPVGPLFHQYARTVRDLSSAHGKSARLVTIGDDVEIDTSAVELLHDPLTHMIRNAIDHGLESSADRLAAGKPAGGTIALEAFHEAGTILIRVSDDGAGLDRHAIRTRASEIGIDTSRLSDDEVDNLIFENGFSTSSAVTDLSGRGVGMDVVKRSIEALRGTISIESYPGEGTAFLIRLPLTLAVIDGFGVTAGGETYVVPMANVLECVELPSTESQAELSGVLLLRDEIVPYVRLRQLFNLESSAPARENVLVVQHNGRKAGVVVDSFHGASQTVIKPLGNYFDDVPGIAGSSILGSGRVALILDVRAIFDRLEKDHGTE